MKFALLAVAAISTVVAGSVQAQVPTGKMGELRPDQKAILRPHKQLVETDTSVTSVPNPDNGGLHPGRPPLRRPPPASPTTRSPCLRPRTPSRQAASSPLIPAPPPRLGRPSCSLSSSRRRRRQARRLRDPYNWSRRTAGIAPGGIADDTHGRDRADTLIRFQQSGYKPAHREDGADLRRRRNRVQRRAIIAINKRDLVDAASALNEGGGGDTDGKAPHHRPVDPGRRKIYRDHWLELRPASNTEPGGARQRDLRDERARC